MTENHTLTRVRRSLEPGTSVLVGTVDARGVPSCCRGLALVSDDDLATARVYVPIATSQETIANIATTARIAVCMSHPVDHATIQLKGRAVATRLATEAEAARVRGLFKEFGAVLGTIGIPQTVMRTIVDWPAFAIDIEVDAVFEQTPGPKAGVPLPRDNGATKRSRL